MKKLAVILILLSTAGFAQQPESDSTMLGRMTKVQLADVYLKEVQRVVQSMTYVTFDSIPADVPSTKYTKVKFDKVKKKMDAYNETILKELMEIIPYSDKKDILESILYLKQL